VNTISPIFLDTVWADLCAVRTQAPLVHSVTNLVVTAFNANTLLAAGASPIMAHAMEEVADLARISGAVVVNIGTLDAHWVPAMQLALDTARAAGKPSVLDPVGAGASAYRNRVLADLMARQPSVVRGNASEIMSLAGHSAQTKGVDSTDPVELALAAAQALSEQHACVVCVSGPEDHVLAPDGRHAVLRNGHPLMTRVTGVGCSASALVGAFAAVQPDAWRACTSAMAYWGVVGQIAAARMAPDTGTGRYASALLDVASTLTQAELAATLRAEALA
jgi:hydroxyethylthiazole kinase